MTKVTKLVLMLCLTLSGALCHVSGVARTENEKGNEITHPVLKEAVSNHVPLWNGSDAVTISYVKYNQLEFDCDTDVAIRNVNDINNYQPGVKHSVAIGSSSGLGIPANKNIAFRASESITIDNQLTIPSGAQVTMIVQGCPDLE